MRKTKLWSVVVYGMGVVTAWACESSTTPTTGTPSVTPGDTASGDGDTGAADIGDSEDSSDIIFGDTDQQDGVDTTKCDRYLEVTFRDFNESHPDFERSDPGWGPLAGVLEPTLDEERKPIFRDVNGSYTWKQDSPPDALEPNCWDSGPGTPQQCYKGTIPMFEGAESFYDWYHDTPNSIRIDKQLEMMDDPDNPGAYVYDSNAFFPLGPDEGFGITPAGNQLGKNFLFTTEIHLQFQYRKGQKFTFRGDDDLWIFVNGRLALDLGGMHLPFEGTIDFDAKAEELGIVPGGYYYMDIFHAERHTSESNFRIQTNIDCFVPIVILE